MVGFQKVKPRHQLQQIAGLDNHFISYNFVGMDKYGTWLKSQ
jgi:hypothetical protein